MDNNEANQRLNEFYEKCDNAYAELYDLYKEFNKKSGLTYDTFMRSNKPENPEFHKSILSILNKYFSSAEDLYVFDAHSNIENNELQPILDAYCNDFAFNKFFVLDAEKEKGVKPYEFLEFNPEGNITYCSQAFEKLRYKDTGLAIIINPEGECFSSPYLHHNLCRWLFANGHELSGSLRINIDLIGHQFGISSLAGHGSYDYLLDTSNEEFIYITDEQAQSLANLYDKYSKVDSNMPELKSSLTYSYNLGLNSLGEETRIKENTDHNLGQLQKAFGDKFDRTEYYKDYLSIFSGGINGPLYYSEHYLFCDNNEKTK